MIMRMDAMLDRTTLGKVLMLLGVASLLLCAGLYKWQITVSDALLPWLGIGGALAAVGGIALAQDIHVTELNLLGIITVKLARSWQRKGPPRAEPKTLSENEHKEKESYADQKPVPGRAVSTFRVLTSTPSLTTLPTADPGTPMYLLDDNFRILDWNEAFSLAFDYTMEGRRGESVLEWTYFLDNYEEVLDRGTKDFAEGLEHPPIHVEPLEYTSLQYGKLKATKRAYKIPNDDHSCFGWLVILDVQFAEDRLRSRYKRDLLEMLRDTLMWSDYALSYDTVLTNTDVYPDLLKHILGQKPDLEPVANGARVLELGAGTGNLTVRLAEPSKRRVVFALENNPTMLEMLRTKCAPYLRHDEEQPGVIAIKQDIRSLNGLPPGYFDYVLANNVLYSLDDDAVVRCLEGVDRVLKPDGELRISGPRKNTKLSRLFRVIKKDLRSRRKFDEVRENFEHVLEINERQLGPRFRWSLSDVTALLERAGFHNIVYSTERAYAGQAMVIFARK